LVRPVSRGSRGVRRFTRVGCDTSLPCIELVAPPCSRVIARHYHGFLPNSIAFIELLAATRRAQPARMGFAV
ncbi:hypothetical protein Dimus_034627, partial [Dionaea muscipula]